MSKALKAIGLWRLTAWCCRYTRPNVILDKDAVCEAGVRIWSVTPRPGEPGDITRMPCFKMPIEDREGDAGVCAKCSFPRPWELRARDAHLQAVLLHAGLLDPMIERMLKRSERRRVRARPPTQCPKCHQETLVLRVDRDGRIFGLCATPNCIALVERLEAYSYARRFNKLALDGR